MLKLSKKKEKLKEVQFVFEEADDYKIAHVNGVWGGVTPRGELVCNFFFEHTPVPNVEIRYVDDKGKLTEKSIRKPSEPSVIRELRVGISLHKEQAISIAKWMLERVKQFEQIQKEDIEKDESQ